MSLLLDANVVSELRKVRAGKADSNVARWADAVDPLGLFVSAITIQELETGVLLAGRKDPVHGALLQRWMDEHVLTGVRQPHPAGRCGGGAAARGVACAGSTPVGQMHPGDHRPPTPEGSKELIGFQVGVRESAQSWRELLIDVQERGLKVSPNGGRRRRPGVLEALDEIFPGARHQRCWFRLKAGVSQFHAWLFVSLAKRMVGATGIEPVTTTMST